MTKNTKRQLKRDVVEKVTERDNWNCVCCTTGKPLGKSHHAYFGAEAQYDKGRNEEDRLVTICCKCHIEIHDQGNKIKIEKCKDYLKNYYEKRPLRLQ